MDLVRFEHSDYLYALFIILLLIFVYVIYLFRSKNKLKKAGDINIINSLIQNKSKFNRNIKFILSLLATAFLILSLANLQFGSKIEKVKREGVDVVIALDLSNSMMAEDVPPNRLARTKQFIYRFMDQLANDRVGLIVFAGKAYVQMPLTIDYAAARLFLSNVNTQIVPTQGTAIGEAIQLSNELFDEGSNKYKTLIVFSDGENHEGNAVDIAKEATKKGVVIHTVGVGTTKGAPIPVYRGSEVIDYRKDNNDQIILTKLNEQMLQEISTVANGRYFRITNSENSLKQLVKTVEQQEKKEIDTRMVTDYNSKFQIFLFAALICLLLEFSLPKKKQNIKLLANNFFNKP